jgi:CarD family transcriptional regulator
MPSKMGVNKASDPFPGSANLGRPRRRTSAFALRDSNLPSHLTDEDRTLDAAGRAIAPEDLNRPELTGRIITIADVTPSAKNPAVPSKTVASARPAADENGSPVALSASRRLTVSDTLAASETTKVAKKATEKAAVAAAPAPKASQPASSQPIDARAVAAKIAPSAKPKSGAAKLGFKLNEFIVYPAHGVGQIVGIEVQEVAGFSLELFVVSFIKDKMTLKVPTSKVASVGMRKLAETEVVEKALMVLSGRARIKRTMWSRRAQEYEAKINSGDLVTIAEVVRDLYRSDTQPEQSYSERQLYEAALDRMAREVAAVRKLIDAESLKLIESFLQKGPRRGQKADADIDVAEDDEADVDRAA